MNMIGDGTARATMGALGFLALMAGLGGQAMAGLPPLSTPEIDPGSMVNAMLVLSGSLLMLNGRRRRK